jgi:hypothetical protein
MEHLANLLMLYFGGIGMTLILVSGAIFEPVRAKLRQLAADGSRRWIKPIHDIAHCPQCCGFWVGFFIAIIYSAIQQTEQFFTLQNGLFIFLLACSISFLSMTADFILAAIFKENTN